MIPKQANMIYVKFAKEEWLNNEDALIEKNKTKEPRKLKTKNK